MNKLKKMGKKRVKHKHESLIPKQTKSIYITSTFESLFSLSLSFVNNQITLAFT